MTNSCKTDRATTETARRTHDFGDARGRTPFTSYSPRWERIEAAEHAAKVADPEPAPVTETDADVATSAAETAFTMAMELAGTDERKADRLLALAARYETAGARFSGLIGKVER